MFSTLNRKDTLGFILKNAIIDSVPIFFIGFIASIVVGIPVSSYQEFITGWNNGIIAAVLNAIYDVTIGIQTVYTLLFFGRHVFSSKKIEQSDQMGLVATAVSSFCIFTEVVKNTDDILGPKGLPMMFLAILVSYSVYMSIGVRTKRFWMKWWRGTSSVSYPLQILFPTVTSIAIISIIDRAIVGTFHVTSITSLIYNTVYSFFYQMPMSFLKSSLLIIASGLLWFCGIHGTMVLMTVFRDYFIAILLQNGDKIAFNSSFYTTFVLMGGAGGTICLVVALLIYARKIKYEFRIANYVAFFLSIFNINEFLIFGLPIIYNKILFIPFIIVPIIFYAISSAAMYMGLVPFVSPEYQISWMTPIFVNGYVVTGSVAGIFLQVVNLIVGTVVYYPFAKKYLDTVIEDNKKEYNYMIEQVKASEKTGENIPILSAYTPYISVAIDIYHSIRDDVKNGNINLYYQPQFDNNNECVGAEALLRFISPTHGLIYPPLIFKIAKEDNFSVELDKAIVIKALEDITDFIKIENKKKLKTSINVCGASIQSDEFEYFLVEVAKRYDLNAMNVCIEVTEQDALVLSNEQRERFARLRNLGFKLAIDDFSMGNTSAHYLTADNFDIVKLDGSLVREIVDNKRTQNVVSSIIDLANTLKVEVIAEFVSSMEIRDALENVGCNIYQGYLFSPAVTKEEYMNKFLKGVEKIEEV